MKKIVAFNSIKIKAGKVIQRLSSTFILTATPKSIKIASPPEEINKMKGTFKPTSRPTPPNISKTAVSMPAFSSPKRLNSIFIWGVVK